MRLSSKLPLLIALTIAAPQFLPAQTPFGSIVGTVLDSSGLPLAGATVEVINEGTNIGHKVKTSETGDYSVPLLPVGIYKITAQAAGFKSKSVSGLELEVGGRPRVDLQLEVGQITESISIMASAPLVQSETANFGTVIDNKKIMDLPLNGRRSTTLAYLVPGVTKGVFGMPSGSGARSTANDIIVDGITTSRFSTNQPAFNPLNYEGPSVDSVQEFKVQLNTFTAENGRGVTAIHMITKTGTNDFHGSLYDFLRNGAFDARSFFDARTLPFSFNQYGLAGGGPVIVPGLYNGKNRTFFFASWESIKRRQTNNAFANVPTPAMLDGDFTGVTVPRDTLTGQPFPNNRIPQNRFSEFAKNFRQFIPAPNRVADARGNIQTGVASRDDAGSWLVRLDHRFSDRDQVFGRYFEATNVTTNASFAPLAGRLLDIYGKSLVIDYNHTFSPRKLNEFRAGYGTQTINNLPETAFGSTNYAVDVMKVKNIDPGGPAGYGLPGVSIQTFSAMGQGGLQAAVGVERWFSIVDHFTYYRGSHQLKMGFESKIQQGGNGPGFIRLGAFSFLSTFTGSPVGDYLLGLPTVSQVGVGNPATLLAANVYDGFIQDDWKVSPRLTLNFGMRYEYAQALRDRDDRNRLSTLDINSFPTARFLLAGSSKVYIPGQGVVDTGGGPLIRKSLIDPDWNDFQPRFGFAWRPFGGNKTAIRGGYGIYIDPQDRRGQSLQGLHPPYFFFAALIGQYQIDQLFPTPSQLPVGAALSYPQAVHNRDPYIHQWSFNIQREVMPNLLLEVGYLGSRGLKLQQAIPLNQARLDADPTRPTPVVSRQKYLNLATTTDLTRNIAMSYYNGLATKLEKRYSNGLSFMAAYTFSKSIDTSSQPLTTTGSNRLAQDQNNVLAGERGLSDFDRRHVAVISYTYELPFARGSKGAIKTILGGWQLNGITSFSSGPPFTPTVAADRANVGTPGGSQRAEQVAPVRYLDIRQTGRHFDSASFALPAVGRFGSSGRNILIGPGANNWDASLMKNTRIDERFNVQFRAEFFNLWNHAQFANPAAGVDGFSFGVVSGAGSGRVIQLGLKVLF